MQTNVLKGSTHRFNFVCAHGILIIQPIEAPGFIIRYLWRALVYKKRIARSKAGFRHNLIPLQGIDIFKWEKEKTEME